MPQTQIDYFVSYATPDRPWAEWIAWQLESEGLSTSIQSWDFRPGNDFVERMDEALRMSNRMIVVLSHNYFNSAYGKSEWREKFRGDPSGDERAIVPVRIDDVEPAGLLGSRIYIDLSGLSHPRARSALLDGLKGAARPHVEPQFPGPRIRTNRPRFPGDEILKHWELAPGEIEWQQDTSVVYFPEESRYFAAGIALGTYATIDAILDDLYAYYLSDIYGPYKYGVDWVLSSGFRVIAPASWVNVDPVPPNRVSASWLKSTTPQLAGFTSVRGFCVVRPSKKGYCAVKLGGEDRSWDHYSLKENSALRYYISHGEFPPIDDVDDGENVIVIETPAPQFRGQRFDATSGLGFAAGGM